MFIALCIPTISPPTWFRFWSPGIVGESMFSILLVNQLVSHSFVHQKCSTKGISWSPDVVLNLLFKTIIFFIKDKNLFVFPYFFSSKFTTKRVSKVKRKIIQVTLHIKVVLYPHYTYIGCYLNYLHPNVFKRIYYIDIYIYTSSNITYSRGIQYHIG